LLTCAISSAKRLKLPARSSAKRADMSEAQAEHC
jgi:hypothetical protein